MKKNKKNIIIIAILILVGMFVILKVVGNIKNNRTFLITRSSYEENVSGITIDDIVSNTYIASLSVRTDFKTKDNYDQYDTQYDKIDISVRLSNDFETMNIKDRITALGEIDEEIFSILSEEKERTGYAVLVDDYVPYKGSKVQVVEELEICYNSASKTYEFYNGFYHSHNSISIKGENGKSGYIEYEVEWNGNNVVSVKEKNNSSSSYTPMEEDYNSLTYRTVTDDKTLGEVWAMTQSFVKDKLKSPKSADFPVYGDSQVSIQSSGNYYKVTGYVDAENSFGAQVRATFSLVMKKSGDKYTLKECKIYE